jgi:pimeloyl-ACP methyl ester carboxylesterase
MMLVEKSFDTGEVVLNYAEGPNNGPPMLLIHGFQRRWKLFQPIIPELSKNYHIFAIDLRGHGKSGRVKGHYTLKEYFNDISILLEKLVHQPSILFGSSLGGWISLMVASKKPTTVKALIIGDSPLNLRELRKVMKRNQDTMTKRRRYSMKTYEELVKVLDVDSAERLSLLDPDIFTLWLEGMEDSSAFDRLMEGFEISKLLQGFDCPVLLLQGNGQVLTDVGVEYAKSIRPDIVHVYFEDKGHLLGLDTGDSGELLSAVTSFLESLK